MGGEGGGGAKGGKRQKQCTCGNYIPMTTGRACCELIMNLW